VWLVREELKLFNKSLTEGITKSVVLGLPLVARFRLSQLSLHHLKASHMVDSCFCVLKLGNFCSPQLMAVLSN